MFFYEKKLQYKIKWDQTTSPGNVKYTEQLIKKIAKEIVQCDQTTGHVFTHS